MAEVAMVDYRNGVREYPQGTHPEAAPTPARGSEHIHAVHHQRVATLTAIGWNLNSE